MAASAVLLTMRRSGAIAQRSGMYRPTAALSRSRSRPRWAAPLVLIPFLLGGCASEGGSGVQSTKISTIKARGKLICGVDGSLPGFSFVGPDGTYSGLDVDVCKAMAAALFGDPLKVEYRNLNSSERFAALASGEVDLLSRNTTMTLSRDAAGGNALSFAPPTFYDGQGVMAPTASGIKTLKDLAGKPICVESGTTTELNLADRMREQTIPYTPLKFQTGDQTYAAYLQGRCVAVTSDRSQLAGKRSSFPQPDDHTLLPDVMSKEPLTPATVNADPVWADAVRWTVNTLFQAEELGITKANIAAKVAEARANANQADLRRFLGVEGEFGKQLGLPADFVPKIIGAVGNYGEIFDRNVGPGSRLKLDRGVNKQWKEGGLIYSPPFR
jgi:general L-amino acid transport system substrate-binding protein